MHATVDARREVRKWLPVLRVAFRISQNGFAHDADIDPSILSRWLNGHIRDSAASAKAVAALKKYRRRLATTDKAS